MPSDLIRPGRLAVVTGGASGIGRAAAGHFARGGMQVAILDRDAGVLREAADALATLAPGGAASIRAIPTDVASRDDLAAALHAIGTDHGAPAILMANAGIGPDSDILGPAADWDRLIDVNLHGVIRTVQCFLPGMLDAGRPAKIIVTGSKQGITAPPGNPAYNVSKAGVKVFAESLQHDLRNRSGCTIEAHLLIPGFVFTPLAAKGRAEKPDAAWTPAQVVDFMLDRIEAGDFYVLCPDNDVTRAIDERRIAWAADDLVANRPPLSRWHPDHAAAFLAFLETPH